MRSFRSLLPLASLFGALAVAAPAGAQEAPPPLPPASPPPPASQVTPRAATPPANAVALCNDGTFLVPPALPAACATRGGLKLALPGNRPTPPLPSAQATSRATAPSARSDAPPADATMRCKDGTWLSGAPSPARCAANGGVAAILPPADTRPPRAP